MDQRTSRTFGPNERHGVETIREKRVNSLMLRTNHSKIPGRLLLGLAPIALIGASAAASAEAERVTRLTDPMRFFEGRTEGVSTVKVIMKKPFRSKTIGSGDINGGVLTLVQKVVEEGKDPYDRRWKMRQAAPGRFTGSMTEAVGPVVADEVGGRYRFRFRMKGNLVIEQWLTPLPGGKEAISKVSIRKYGMKVGSSEGTIRRL